MISSASPTAIIAPGPKKVDQVLHIGTFSPLTIVTLPNTSESELSVARPFNAVSSRSSSEYMLKIVFASGMSRLKRWTTHRSSANTMQLLPAPNTPLPAREMEEKLQLILGWYMKRHCRFPLCRLCTKLAAFTSVLFLGHAKIFSLKF